MVKNFLSNLGNNYKGLTLKERLMGQQMPSTDEVDIDTEALKGIDTSNPYFLENYGAESPTVNITASSTPRKGGILPDLASGFNENYATGFAAPNWGENQLDDGRNKGFAYRLGEGLGSIGRFVDSPLGRGLIAAGLNKALGYDNSLQEGLTAAVGRQNAQTADKVYRQQLAEQGIDTSDVRGNINSDIYRQILYGQQLKENADYRNLYLENQARQNEIMNQLRRDQLERQERQDALKNQIDMSRLGLEGQRLGLESKKVGAYLKSLEDKTNTMSEGDRVLTQLDELKNLYDKLPQNKAGKGTQKATAVATGVASQYLGSRNDDVAAFEGVSNMVTNLVARKLAGEKGVMTDKDFDRAKKMVPSVFDSPQQAQAKMNAIKQLYYAPQQSTSNKTNGLDVNMDAIDAELARRGIK